ncbi:MAG: sulfite oxidase [Bacteroidia bacterium]|nr:sulfite oxidase [Bacteroidia bacterium]
MAKKKIKIGVRKLFAEDPDLAEHILWGSNLQSRRKFLSKSAMATMGILIGTKIVFANSYPKGLLPVGLNFLEDGKAIPGKSKELLIINDKPWNAETPAHLLDPKVTPSDLVFVRNNGIPPINVDVDKWTLKIDGESVVNEKQFSLLELKSKFQVHTLQITLECGGNGRSEFDPPAKGNQWTTGAVSCAQWTGVKLKDVLETAGIKSDAVYIGYYGADTHLSGDPDKVAISRGVPIAKALEEECLIAWEMNGKEIPQMNGHPLRLVIGGWPASVSGKWLNRISIRNKIHDGAKMGGQSYRVPKVKVEAGTKVKDEDMKIIESMPVKSLITYPKSGAMVKGAKTIRLRGHAWAGDLAVSAMHVSIDFGATWIKCELSDPINRFAWQHWNCDIVLPEIGYYEVWARATDAKGQQQPQVVPGWNPKGYLNNACHRIAVKRIES